MKWIIATWLVLLGFPVRAQSGYWNADVDSLQQVLAGQRADTARVRTLVHMLHVTELTEPSHRRQAAGLVAELLRLNTRTHQLPQEAPYRQLQAGLQHWLQQRPGPALAALQQAVELFDKGGQPVPLLLIDLAPVFNELHESEGRMRYFQRKLRQYKVAGGFPENEAACHLVLGGSYRHRGNFNQAISHYLRAADLFRHFNRRLYSNELMVAGSTYAEWGNTRKALQYMQMASNWNDQSRIGGLQRFYSEHAIAKLYLRQGDTAAAARYVAKATQTARHDQLNAAQYMAYALVLQSELLLARQQAAAAGPLLTRAQQIADSLQMQITGRPGEFALDATWARYYTMRQLYPQAATSWRQAYARATATRLQMLRPQYLRALIRFEAAHGTPAAARQYSLAYLALQDTLHAAQGGDLLAQYEAERVEQAQNEEITNLRHDKEVQELRLHQRSQLLAVAVAALVLISALGVVLYRQLRLNRQTLAQLRQAQSQLVAAEKWAFVGELSAGIAHELQNPLSFMKRFAEVSTSLVDNMGQQAEAPGLEQEILSGLKQNLQEISQHGLRASGIIRDMLEHARSGNGQRQPTDLNALVLEYLELARQSQAPGGQPSSIEVETALAPNLSLVSAMPPDLGRVLLNLFTNAFYAVLQRQQAGETGYRPLVHISSAQHHGSVQVRVRDNGPGIPEEIRGEVFKPFFTTKPLGEGTGLGLSLSYDIVQSHGGTLRVEPVTGQGTEFIVTLPVG
ncbi:ATP-binding protein [Hymenobacter sp. APR13]|uniref:ATP-binding protein n=1 Tax=Hymenobacter sp. APR13 TaxID=1356852 RepID=UPI0004E09645|nr:ATP-binding protein [Hymenobacter sp. APR13]AII53259.1 hypothetical protein N008_14895 [Hymenobacter sp. APR13]